MSACELARQDRIAQKYWLTRSRNNDESAPHEGELHHMGGRARYAATCLFLSKSRTQELQEDAARLSEILASYRKPAEPRVSLPLGGSPSNRGSTTSEGSDISQTGKFVLWQPVRRAIEETPHNVPVALAPSGHSASSGAINSRIDLRRDGKLVFSGAHTGSNGRQTPDLKGSAVVSQVMRSGATVSKCSASNPDILLGGKGGEDPVLRVFTDFQSTHTAERLFAEHQTVEAAMKALEEGYEKVVTRTSQDVRSHSIQLLDRLTSLRNLAGFYRAQKIQLASIVYRRAQGFAKPVASQHLLNCASKLAVEQQMRPFERQLDFLRWTTYLSGASSPFQALRGFNQQAPVLCNDLSVLVDDLSCCRAFLALENGFKKRYATTKYELETLIRETRRGYTGITYLISSLSRKAQTLYPPIQGEMRSQLGISIHVLDALVEINMRRASVDDHQQGVFGCLDHQFRLFERDNYHLLQNMGSIIHSMRHSREPLLRSHIREIKSLVSAISLQYREDIQALWERHIALMSPQTLERYNSMAQRFWSTRVTQSTLEQARAAGTRRETHRITSVISEGRRSFVKTKRQFGQAFQLSAIDRELQEQAIKAMQRLEEICPSRPPMSEQAFRKILGLEDSSPPRSVPDSRWSRLLSSLNEAEVGSVAGPHHKRVILTSSRSRTAASNQPYIMC